MELIKKNIHMEGQKAKAQTQVTLQEDIIIPDTRPDAGKTILDRGNVIIDEVKSINDHAVVKGHLFFEMLYQQEGLGTPAKMEGQIPFEEQVYMQSIEPTDTVSVKWEMEDLNISLINSRKISVQSIITLITSCDRIFDEEAAVDLRLDEQKDDSVSEDIQYRKKILEACNIITRKKDIYRIKDEVEIPGNLPNIGTMIWNSIRPEAVEFKVLDEKLTIQGEVRIFFMYQASDSESDSEVWQFETTLPFSGSIECSGLMEGMLPEIGYTLLGTEVSTHADYDGEERILSFEANLDLDICIYSQEQIEILSDVYGVRKEISIEGKEAYFRNYMCKASGKQKINSQLKIEEGEPEIRKVLYSESALIVQESNVQDSGIEASGVLNLQVFYEGTTEGSYGLIKDTLPFTLLLEAEGVNEQCIYRLIPRMEQMSVTVTDNKEVNVLGTLGMRAGIYSMKKERVINQAIVSEPDMEKLNALPGMAVYMVGEGESLWDIGKHYYVPVKRLKEMNEIHGDEVKRGDKILVVR